MMQVFRGRNLNEARRAAEAALGPDAVVLTTRKVPRPGLLGMLGAFDVEVAATGGGVVRPPAATPSPARPGPSGAPLPFSDDARKAGASPSPPPAARRDDLTALRTELRNELRAVRSHIDRLPSEPPTSPDWSVFEAEIAGLRLMVERLLMSGAQGADDLEGLVRAVGVEGAPAVALLKAMRQRRAPGETSRDRLRAGLAATVACAPRLDAPRAVVTFVGPTGVGKTTTLAKLAARVMLDEGRTATLVSCDLVRVGATDQLRRYASLLEAPFAIAENAEQLARLVREAGTDYVFVDTAGGAPEGEGEPGWYAGRGKGGRRSAVGPERHVLMCLPAAVRALDAAHLARSFAVCKPTALVVTKLDETAAPAGIVHAAAATRLPVALLAHGPRVPEDLSVATPELVYERIAASAPGGAA
jgi:flagellar biosynthesis protein FlhF